MYVGIGVVAIKSETGRTDAVLVIILVILALWRDLAGVGCEVAVVLGRRTVRTRTALGSWVKLAVAAILYKAGFS